MAGVVLISCSAASWLLSRAATKPVGHDAGAGVRSSASLGRANCFSCGLLKANVGRSRGRRTRRTGSGRPVVVRADRQSDGAGDGSENVDISVFRFTLGIPGFDDSDLPRVVGILFGGLLVLNHAFSLNSITPAQLRSEAVGLFLAAVSISLPAINRQLNGERSSNVGSPSQKQVFALGDGLSDSRRQELAWSSYTLLRNTDSTACLIWYAGKVVCARGFWEIPDVDGPDAKSSSLAWLDGKLKSKRFAEHGEPLYMSNNADGQGLEIIPRGTASLLVQPFPNSPDSELRRVGQGFLLVTSRTPQAYRRKDRLWIEAIAKKLSEVLPQ